MEADKCSDDEYEVVTAGASPRPRTVSLDLPCPTTKESCVNLGSSPSGSVPSSPIATVSNGDKEEQSDNTSYLSRPWIHGVSISRFVVFISFFALAAGMAFRYQKLQVRESHRVELMKENRKLRYALQDREAQIVAWRKNYHNAMMELGAKEAQRTILVEEKQTLVEEKLILVKEKQDLNRELSDKEYQRVMLTREKSLLELELFLREHKVSRLEHKVSRREHQGSRVSEKNERLIMALADTMEALIGCHTSCSPVQQLTVWRRMRDNVSSVIPIPIKGGYGWREPDWLKDALAWLAEALAWLKDQGVKSVEYIYSSYKEPKRLGV